MSGRERAGKPGVTWDRELVRREVYEGLDKLPSSETLEFTDQLAQPVQPANRADRRAQKRAQRRKGSAR